MKSESKFLKTKFCSAKHSYFIVRLSSDPFFGRLDKYLLIFSALGLSNFFLYFYGIFFLIFGHDLFEDVVIFFLGLLLGAVLEVVLLVVVDVAKFL
jgi:hypothetical protein